jgi:D-3-phosphoglycerate dehydrogenase
MIRVLATDGIEKKAGERLKSLGYELTEQFFPPEELAEQAKAYDVLVVRSATKVREPVIRAATESGRLKLIIRGGVGTDNIDVACAHANGVAVKNTPNASSASVAELALGHVFALARHIHEGNVTMREGRWEKKQYTGIELEGKTLGLIGFGRIGRIVADKATALGMRVIYTNRSGHKPENEPYRYVTQDELFSEADFISLHMPKAQAPVITAKEIAKMKDGAYLVNTARGNLISDEDMLAALDSGKLAGVALDVYADEPPKNEKIYTHPKISMTPHVGASTPEAQERIGEEVVAHILDMFG